MSPELQELIRRGETKTVDFKGPSLWNPKDKRACCELVKDILAFANTDGGRIVVGVEEQGSGFTAVGLDEAEAVSWETTKLNQFVNNYSSSPINTTISREHVGERTIVIIEVPRFPRMPHICIKDYPEVLRRAAIYIRTDNNACTEVEDHHQLNGILEVAVRNRSDELLHQLRDVLTGVNLVTPPNDLEQFKTQSAKAESWFDEQYPADFDPRLGFFRVCMFPSVFDENRFTKSTLREAANRANLQYRNWNGLFIPAYEGVQNANDGIRSSFEFGSDPGRFYSWYLFGSGMFVNQQVIADDVQLDERTPWGRHEPGELVSVERIGGIVSAAVDTAPVLYESLGITDENITIRVELENTQGRRLAIPARWTLVGSGLICHEDHILAQLTLTRAEWIAGNVDYALELTNELLELFNLHTSFPRTSIEETLRSRM